MKYFPSNHFRESGFSLIEMAIVLFIVVLLLGGLLPTISSQIDQQRRNETRKQLDEIQQALMGYAISYKRFPCPAIQTIATIPGTDNGAGKPDITGGICNRYTGVLPWVELGLKETDAWERRFTYSVTSAFTASASFSLSTAGTLKILDSTGGNTIANNLPAVVVSHGSNGLGAYLPLGTQISNSSAGTDEKTNSNFPGPIISFVSHEFRPDFDDMVVWITRNTLFNRMVAAGQLP